MAAVLIPWRGGCPHREAALQWVTARYTDAGYTVHLGSPPSGRWCKARAVAAALSLTTDDLLVVADADVWCEGIHDALEGLQTHRWAIPHLRVLRLSQNATAALIRGQEPDLSDLDGLPYWGVQGGGIVALHRDTWHDVPLDPRFEGWGGEDHAWGLALHQLAGVPWIGEPGDKRTPPKGRADLLHLWHPPQDEAPEIRGHKRPKHAPKIPDKANERLNHRYRDAKVSRARMRALVDEAREALCRTPVSS